MRQLAVVALMGPPLALCGSLSAQSGQTPGSVTRLPGWNIEFSLPAGWRVAQTHGRVRMLASAAEPGMILIAPGLYESADEMVADLTRLYASMNQMATPVEVPAEAVIAGLPATVATYDSQDPTLRPVRSRYVNLLTPHGTGLNLLAMASPENFDRMRLMVERLAASVIALTPDAENGVTAALGGTWRFTVDAGAEPARGSVSDRAGEETVTFDGRGGYRWESFSLVAQLGRLSAGGPTSTIATTSEDVDIGSYVVLGNRLVLKGTRGQYALEFELVDDRLIAGGKTYLRQ